MAAEPNSPTWMLYGAYGYTGRLIAREAAARGMRPTLAGRDADKLRPLADELQLPLQAFSLDDTASVAAKLEGFALVLNCAGPFSQTAGPMIEACLQSRTHYLDI
ncbi:MAG: saccharopine dehydrogenase NADP-binding domain-containing protein, partial [Planctomycetales bacterium]|nr:saccharopine dehydrogenase NADP-binding domain-containing protein [Planctomycetales bacterium]